MSLAFSRFYDKVIEPATAKLRHKIQKLFREVKASREERLSLGLIIDHVGAVVFHGLLGGQGRYAEKASEWDRRATEFSVATFDWQKLKTRGKARERLDEVLSRADLDIHRWSATTAVYSDWLEEHGFAEAANELRMKFDRWS